MRRLCLAALLALALPFSLQAQQPKKLPEAPVPVPEPAAGDAIYAPLATGDKPESFKTRYQSWLVISVGPRAIVSPAFSAAFRMANPPKQYPREWKDGAEAFGRNYGDAFARKFSSETARFVTGAALHEDFRYRRSTQPGIHRLFHAIGYVFVDSTDSGHRTFAAANFADAFAGGFTGTLYLPDNYNTTGNALRRSGTHFISFATSNILREYSPEIARFFGSHHLPFPHLPIPEWYTKGISVARR